MRVYKIVSFSVVILLIAVLFAGVATVPAAAQYDTMQFRYNAQHTGDYGPVAGSNMSKGLLTWSFTTGSVVLSSPTVVDGVVYVGSEDNNTYALNATTGAKVWNYTTGGGVDSSTAVVNGVVYVGSDDNNTYALSANNGTKLWNYTTGGPVQSSPAVANGVVYVGSLDNNTYALNATTGAKLWSFTTGGAVWSSPAVVNGVVYVGSADGNVYAIGNESVSQQTTLTVSAPSFAAINRPFTINGTLNTTGGTAISGATIQLQKNVSGTWANVTGKTNTTTSTGAYRISTSEPAVGTYQYRTIYAGNASVASATSPVVSVKVVSKASVLADLNALRLTVMGIPSSAFIPGTKIATLALISAAEINVRVGNPGAAATELKTALLPHISGCSATGKPDSNDWVRTCAAQGQLYPQVQNLIQELQALQGS